MLGLLCCTGMVPIKSTKDAVTAEPSDRDIIYKRFVHSQLRRKVGVEYTTLCTNYLSLRHTDHLQTPLLIWNFIRKQKNLGKGSLQTWIKLKIVKCKDQTLNLANGWRCSLKWGPTIISAYSAKGFLELLNYFGVLTLQRWHQLSRRSWVTPQKYTCYLHNASWNTEQIASPVLL